MLCRSLAVPSDFYFLVPQFMPTADYDAVETPTPKPRKARARVLKEGHLSM